MKHSKKSYDSFQDELEDYIKVQKARGLEPKTCFRKLREDYLETCGYRELDSRPRYQVFDPRPPSGTVQTCPRSRSTPHTVESQPPQCSPAQDPGSCSQLPKDCFLEKPVPTGLGQRVYDCGSYDMESRVRGHLSSRNSPSAHPTSHKEVHQRRKRGPEEGREKTEEERPRHRKRGSEEADSDRHRGIQRKKAKAKAEAAQVGAERPKNRKEKRSREAASKREGRKHKRARKDQGKERADEELLWDQSILGF
uniref:Lysine-rich coiled-coil protein 1 n=1 Tax=Sciurus vulgaris TaxID=55149 RepID=A0A8D2JMB0_SCIVU